MKKLLFIILCVFFATTLQAQLASWGTPMKVMENLNAPNQSVAGKYITTFDGKDYYAFYTRKMKFVKLEDTRFAFIEANGNKITKSTPYSEGQYDYLDVSATESQLCVTYVTGEKKAKRNVKIDYFNPATLKKAQTVNLFSFDPIGKDDPYIEFVRSDNNDYLGVIANGKHPDTGAGTIIVKCFNNKFEELWTSYYDYKGNNYPELGDIFISNEGKVLIHFLTYESDKKKTLKTFHFTQISDENISEVEYTLNNKIEIIEYKLGEYKDNQFLFVYTDEKTINAMKINFIEESATKMFTHETYEGNWRIDKIADLKNGNFTIAVQNRDLLVIVNRGVNNTVETNYLYWNRSFLFIGINGETDDKTFAKTLGREYNVTLGFPTSDLNITIEPFYFVKEGDLHVVYNTVINTKDNVSKQNEKPNYFSTSLPKFNTRTITKMAVVTDNGNLNVKTVFNSKTDKGVFLSKFSHIDENNDLIIAKAKKKVLTIGKVNL